MTLRATETSLLSSMFLATCCVMVLAPMGRLPAVRSATSYQPARSIASGSTPLWLQNFWSSADRNACLTTSGMALIGT